MFKKTTTTPTPLDEAIDRVLADMEHHESDSAEYEKMVDKLERLYKLKTLPRPERVSPDVLATVAANLAGIALIVGHERAHIVTSKAIGFVQKLR